MKILFITGLHPIKNNPVSGIFITRRMKKLKEYGIYYDLFFFSEKTSPAARLFKWLLNRPSFKEQRPQIVQGIQYSPLPVRLSIGDMIFYYRRIGQILVKAVKDQLNLKEYDLIHAHWAYPQGFIATLLKKGTGLPCIISVHGSDIHTNPLNRPQSIPSVISALESADKVFFNNNKILETARGLGYGGSNYTIIPTGVETNLFVPMDKKRVRAKLGLYPLDDKYVGFAGNLKPVKGADRLPDIFREISKKRKKVQFIVIGDGKLRRTIESRCKEYNLQVKFTGQIEPEEMPTWINALDALLLPSRKEGFPNVCLEAQSCGCPVVGSNVGGIPEAIGDGGAVVEENETFVKQFSDAVIKIIDHPFPLEKLRDRALQYDWDIIIRKQIDIYNGLLLMNGK